MSVYDAMIEICDCNTLRKRLAMAAVLHAPEDVNPDWWVATHIQRFAADERVHNAWIGDGSNKSKLSPPDNVTPEIIEAVVTDLVIADQVAEDAKAIADKAKREAEKAAQAEADKAMRDAQLEDEIRRAEMQALLAEHTSTVPQSADGEGAVSNSVRRARRNSAFKEIRQAVFSNDSERE